MGCWLRGLDAEQEVMEGTDVDDVGVEDPGL